MLVAGLTGGIATGKSTVAGMLAEFGAFIIDADRLARDAVEKGMPAYARVVAHFGHGILLPDGTLDRKRLGEIVFSSAEEKKTLEEMVHPWVKEETARRLERIRQNEPLSVAVLDVPLLFESEMTAGLAEIIVVYAPEAMQIRRLMARDHLTEADALARIRSQVAIEEKKHLASIVIDNSGSLADTRRQARQVYDDLAARAREAH
jgi:dephospho-CoA kinase